MKITLTNDDNSTIDFIVAPVIAPEVVDVTAGETIEVINIDPVTSVV